VYCQLVNKHTGFTDGSVANGICWNNIIAYRIKKEPVVMSDVVWINGTGEVFDTSNAHATKDSRKAIITLTDGNPSIEWADDET